MNSGESKKTENFGLKTESLSEIVVSISLVKITMENAQGHISYSVLASKFELPWLQRSLGDSSALLWCEFLTLLLSDKFCLLSPKCYRIALFIVLAMSLRKEVWISLVILLGNPSSYA